jgi:diguanylate cyclase (GGDEF)-like protein
LGKACPVIISLEKQLSRYNDLQGYLLIAKDNRQIKSLKDDLRRLSGSNTELRDLSIKDPLTGIYNRAKFLASLEREELQVKRYSARISIIMFDIDHFKVVNDTHGHDMGDIVLKSVVQTVLSRLREGDVMARWGGEEFIILSRNTELNHGEALAERLRQSLEEMNLEKVGRVTASFGVSQFLPSESHEELLKRVDVNLYKAKEQGRNCVVSDPIPHIEKSV